jgi:hypothetical protein
LTEHYHCGLPTPAEIAWACAAVDGFRATPLAMPNGLPTTATTLAELTGLLEATALSALRCPECDGTITVEGPDLLLCGSCDLPVPRDESGA